MIGSGYAELVSKPTMRIIPHVLILFAPHALGFLPQGQFRPRISFTVFRAVPEDVKGMSAGQMKKELESYGISTKGFLEKYELVDALEKARERGLEPKSTFTSGSSDDDSTSDPLSRETLIEQALLTCMKMRNSELRQELEDRGISTRGFLEKQEFALALAEAMADGVTKKSTGGGDDEGYAEYADIEVLTSDDAGPRKKSSETEQTAQSQFGSNPFGGGTGSPFGGGTGSPFGGANPFAGTGFGGGSSDMGGFADILKNMGGMGTGGNSFGGNPFGGENSFGGDAMAKAQRAMQNPKVREIIAKAQSNPKLMAAVSECMSNPAAFAKYKNDPEVASLITELQKYL